jgi:hypothetical protein
VTEVLDDIPLVAPRVREIAAITAGDPPVATIVR